MLREATKDDFPTITEFLKRKLPVSLPMSALIQMEVEFDIGRTVYVSDPDPTLIILGRRIKPSRQTLCVFVDSDRLSEEEMRAFMKLIPGWDWFSPFTMCFTMMPVADQVRAVLTKDMISPLKYRVSEYRSTLFEIKAEDIQTPKLPKEFKFGSIKSEHVPLLLENWDYSSSEDLNHFQRQVEKSLSSAVFKVEDEHCENPLSWVFLYDYGLTGMTFTVPEFRRLGLASAVVRDLCIKVSRTKVPVIVCIMDNNLESHFFHEKLGFKKVGIMKWIGYEVE